MKRWDRIHLEQDESIMTLLCDKRYCMIAESAINKFRTKLNDLIKNCPEFKTSHEPLAAPTNSHSQIKRMYDAAFKVNVGPMASVAGAIAEIALTALLEAGAKEAIVDNGGDIALSVNATTAIGIYAGSSSVQNLAFKIGPYKGPLGICTSSGTVGHSFSYGRADAAVVISENIPLADAAATALGNRVQNSDDLNRCFDFLKPIKEIQGALVIFEDRIAMWGALPDLVEADVNTSLITKGQPSHMEKVHVENLR